MSTTLTAPRQLTADELTQYRRDGYVIVRSLYDPATIATWKREVKARLEREAFNDPSGVRVFWSQELEPWMKQAMSEPNITAMMQQVIGPDVEFLSVKAVYKNNATSFASPWHQDWFYWEGATKVSVWIALDQANQANGCLKVIPGSQAKVFPRKTTTSGAGFVNVIEDQHLQGWPVVPAPCNLGDAIIFHDLLVHASFPNQAGSDRWSFISTYRSGSVPDDSKVWSHSMLVSGQSCNPTVKV